MAHSGGNEHLVGSDIAVVFTLLRLINRNDADGAYRLASRCCPEELVVALAEAHLGPLRIGASRELGASVASTEVTERVDQMLDEALQACRAAAVNLDRHEVG
jgi:hypothetical protein